MSHSEMSPNGVSRRVALQGLAGLGGVAWTRDEAGHPVVRHVLQGGERPAGAGLPRLLDEHQFQTLSAFAEIVVPGARATESDLFIDRLLAVQSRDTKRRFLSALGAIEGAAVTEHRKTFLELTAAEQEALLVSISRQATGLELAGDATPADKPTDKDDQAPEAPITLRDHFDHLKGWVAGAYYSSEVGMRELGWTEVAFFPGVPSCTHPEGHR